MENDIKAISKETQLKLSLGTIWAVILFLVGGTYQAFGMAAQINSNTQGLQAIVQSLEISRISDDISDLKKERRAAKKDLRADPDNSATAEYIDELDDLIDDAVLEKECILDPEKLICSP